jgi:hypothetical protein
MPLIGCMFLSRRSASKFTTSKASLELICSREGAKESRSRRQVKSFLIGARRILEDCEASIRKAQRISHGEIGELAIGYISALTHDFLGKALKVWWLTSPGIIIDCIEMDSVSQERPLL